jgi:Dolichyl-phosphate-mannose-protein mannosyltransferase
LHLLRRTVDLVQNPFGRWQLLAVALFHLLALALVSRLAHWSYPIVLLALVGSLLPFQLYARLKSQTLKPVSALLPLFILYGVTVLRLIIALITRVTCSACEPVPQPLANWLSYEWAAVLTLYFILIVQALQVFPVTFQPRLAAFALLTLSLVWIAILFPRLIPSGVTGADPFAYAQMGVDLASHLSPFHHFALADLARQLNLPIYPALFVGYTIPTSLGSTTVWPIGFSALLAIAYKVFGEQGLYLFNPFLGIVSAAVTALLAWRVFRLSPFFSLLAAALLLTSFEQTIRLSIPLADIAAQLFTTLAIIVALTDWHKATYWQFAVCGALCALAFVTRYTQLLIAPGLLLILLWRFAHKQPNKLRITNYVLPTFIFAISFLIVSSPDFLYRTAAFGSPLAFAAGELGQFSAADILPVTLHFLSDLAADLNLALPFVLIGLVFFTKENRQTALGLLLALGPVCLFHLPYHYLKLRDLLFIFPALYALAAYGFAGLLTRLQHLKRGQTISFVICNLSLFIALSFRFAAQLPLLSGYYTYGFLTAQGRAQIDSIATLTPPQAVIAASLNSGAISLYTGRDTFRPGHLLQPGRTWTDTELSTFVEALHQQGRPLYLLADSEEMADPLSALSQHWHLTPIAELYLPYYYRDGSAINDLIPLYRLDLP